MTTLTKGEKTKQNDCSSL